MKSIVRKDTGDDYTTYLKKLCEAQGIQDPTVEDARRMDRKRKGKKSTNKEWQSPTDADARIVRLKDGRTRLGYKVLRDHPKSGQTRSPQNRPTDRGARQVFTSTRDRVRVTSRRGRFGSFAGRI
jgi:hypothetical protein